MITLSVPDMTCGHCKASVETALKPLTTAVFVNLTTHEVAVEGAPDAAAIIAALGRIGYAAALIGV